MHFEQDIVLESSEARPIAEPPVGNNWNKLARIMRNILFIAGICILSLLQGYFKWFVPPESFPINTVITIPEGSTLQETASILEQYRIVNSSFAIQNLVIVLNGQDKIQAGDYFFERPMTVYEVAARIITGDFGLRPIKVTIPEGTTTYQIAAILEDKLGRFDPVQFTSLAHEKEGYLFPDTYFFLPNASIQQILAVMEENFYLRIEELKSDIAASGYELHEVVTMASLLEREGRDLEERQMIAGVLWKRIEIGMPLQVDAVFGYIYGTETFSPKYSHLKVESPYNTYTNKGLPPGPIANPGIASLRAAVTPEKHNYLFYLTGRNGKTYYSTTYAQHVSYKQSYLD